MLKSTILLGLLMSACALDPSNLDEATSASTTCECTECCEEECCEHDCCKECPPPPEPGPQCTDNGVVVDLDSAPANVNNFDRKVTYCHATSSATNPYVVITTSINACRAHEEHEHLEQGGHLDVFPTGGCQD